MELVYASSQYIADDTDLHLLEAGPQTKAIIDP